jgi:hypothetical protein
MASQLNPLQQTAQSMRLQLLSKNNDWKYVALPRGLHIVLQRTGRAWRLALAREGVYPSEDEVQICHRSFAVPEGAEVALNVQMRPHPKTKQTQQFNIVEARWREVSHE